MEAQATLSQVKLNVVWEVSSVPAILDLVRSGYGFAALTPSALSQEMTDQRLAMVPIVQPRIMSTLCLVQSAKRQATPLIKRTSDVLRKLALQAIEIKTQTPS